jgi:PBP4 family serine-type D-alanyl-D-alanine carboxypeptidase
MKSKKASLALALAVIAAFVFILGRNDSADSADTGIPPDIKAIFDKPAYKNSTWGLQLVDLETGKVLIDVKPDYNFFIGSVRKVFSVGRLLNQIGAGHKFVTPIYKHGKVNSSGALDGELILVASGDLTMGGRTEANGKIAVTNFDHNESDSLGNSQLSKPNPLQGYEALARQVAAAGIKQVNDVVIDDRLFQPFPFRNEGNFAIRPIFVNDDCVDLIINPSNPGEPISLDWRPKSAALTPVNKAATSGADTDFTIGLEPEFPPCIGSPGCKATITGELPVNFKPPLTNEFPLIRTFRIVEPQNYARTVLIEQLEKAGVNVLADAVAENPAALLPAKNSYSQDDLVTFLVSLPYAEYAKFILKVSYNIGADTSLILWGTTQGFDNMDDSLEAERKSLTGKYGIPGKEFLFVDGSGGGETTATNPAVTKWLEIMTKQPVFDAFFAALPILGVDGSLGFVTDFEKDPTLAGAKGQVHAKTGTFAAGDESGLVIKGQAFGGYIDTKSGRRLVYQLVVNNVPISEFNQLLEIFQDEGTISAILWRDY